MIIFLHKGKLPWQGITIADIRERYKQIGLIKHGIKATVLCSSMPPQYATFLSTVKKLTFEQRPAYEELRANFYQALLQMGVMMLQMKCYDWNEDHEPKSDILASHMAAQQQQQQQEQEQ